MIHFPERAIGKLLSTGDMNRRSSRAFPYISQGTLFNAANSSVRVAQPGVPV
jgi:hypothetical protein